MERPLTKNIRSGKEPLTLKDYEKAGGYRGVRKALLTMAPPEVTKLVKDANLRGRGGAGFPTGMKWSFVPMGEEAPRTKYLIVNADEMEPGTFKDRFLLEGDPHQLIEGMIIAAYAVQAPVAYIFLRWAYKRAAALLTTAMGEAYQAGYLKKYLGFGLQPGHPCSHQCRPLHLRGRDRLAQCPGGQKANPQSQAAFPPGGWSLGQAHRGE